MNTILWRVVVIEKDGYSEGFYSFLDAERTIKFDRFAHDAALFEATKNLWPVQRMAWFTDGFFRMKQVGNEVRLADLRMGQEPNYVFEFVVARSIAGGFTETAPTVAVGERGDAARGLSWVWTRLKGNLVPPPR